MVCQYCGADLIDPSKIDWKIGQQRSFPCSECGCVNYVKPVVAYQTSTFGREIEEALFDLVERHGGSHQCYNGDVELISMPYRGVYAELSVCFENGYGVVDGLHVNVGKTPIPVLDLAGMSPDKAAVRLLLRIFRECRKQKEEMRKTVRYNRCRRTSSTRVRSTDAGSK